MKFSTDYNDILDRIKKIDPIEYGRTRNFVDGAVTYLSPYISRGVISTKQVMNHVLSLGCQPYQVNKLLQELAWRDYWQQIWIEKGDLIDQDFRHDQPEVENHKFSKAILESCTYIKAIDEAISEFYSTGYLHNHIRMYVAALACNAARSHWFLPAQWMYYHLLDGDWASNALSWQWVAGSNSNKKYVANQENINKYCHTNQKDTILDISYEKIGQMDIPELLKDLVSPDLKTSLPEVEELVINNSIPTCVYNNYNLDPLWKKEIESNRVLLLEPSHFEKYPVSKKVIDFIIELSENIQDIQIFVGGFNELANKLDTSMVYYKEHPTANHYTGICDDRDWMFSIKGYYPSFFNFWKKCKKELKKN